MKRAPPSKSELTKLKTSVLRADKLSKFFPLKCFLMSDHNRDWGIEFWTMGSFVRWELHSRAILVLLQCDSWRLRHSPGCKIRATTRSDYHKRQDIIDKIEQAIPNIHLCFLAAYSPTTNVSKSGQPSRGRYSRVLCLYKH